MVDAPQRSQSVANRHDLRRFGRDINIMLPLAKLQNKLMFLLLSERKACQEFLDHTLPYISYPRSVVHWF
jgi:hypothetical protein